MSVKFSPHEISKLALSTSDNFGIVGKGKLFILDLLPEGKTVVSNVFEE